MCLIYVICVCLSIVMSYILSYFISLFTEFRVVVSDTIPHENDVRIVFISFVCRRDHVLFMSFVFVACSGVL